ncbi:MAG: hypothetical protein ACR2JY_22000 [Chloroflexota bacterium]
MNDAEMERQLRKLPPEIAELVSKVRSGELPVSMLPDLVAELEDLGRSNAELSAALDRLYEVEQGRHASEETPREQHAEQ